MMLAGPYASWLNPGEESDPIIPKVPSQMAGHFPFDTSDLPSCGSWAAWRNAFCYFVLPIPGTGLRFRKENKIEPDDGP